MRVLNLYSGIGGNRKLWEDVEVTAVEHNEEVAEVYARYFPDDNLIVADAHQYLLDHYGEFDFIWSSVPCQSHSKMARVNHKRYNIRQYPDMRLYQEIIFLKEFFAGKWVVENVNPYYDILIPAKEIERHLFWANFRLGSFSLPKIENFIDTNLEDLKKWLGFDDFNKRIYLNDNHDPCQILRNCVHPRLGQYVMDCAKNVIRSNSKQLSLI